MKGFLRPLIRTDIQAGAPASPRPRHWAKHGTPFNRVVPKGGAILSGHFVPEGTVVVICGWATQRDKGVSGDDTESFRPKRRLDADEEQIRVLD